MFWHFEPKIFGFTKTQSAELAKLHLVFHEESYGQCLLIQIGGFPQFRPKIQAARPKFSVDSTTQLSTCPKDY